MFQENLTEAACSDAIPVGLGLRFRRRFGVTFKFRALGLGFQLKVQSLDLPGFGSQSLGAGRHQGSRKYGCSAMPPLLGARTLGLGCVPMLQSRSYTSKTLIPLKSIEKTEVRTTAKPLFYVKRSPTS